MAELAVPPLFRPATYFRTDLMEKRAEVEIFPSKEGSKLYLRMDGVDNVSDGHAYTLKLGKMMLRARGFQAGKTARHGTFVQVADSGDGSARDRPMLTDQVQNQSPIDTPHHM